MNKTASYNRVHHSTISGDEFRSTNEGHCTFRFRDFMMKIIVWQSDTRRSPRPFALRAPGTRRWTMPNIRRSQIQIICSFFTLLFLFSFSSFPLLPFPFFSLLISYSQSMIPLILHLQRRRRIFWYFEHWFYSRRPLEAIVVQTRVGLIKQIMG